jgi:hypothetical protein
VGAFSSDFKVYIIDLAYQMKTPVWGIFAKISFEIAKIMGFPGCPSVLCTRQSTSRVAFEWGPVAFGSLPQCMGDVLQNNLL